MSLNKVAEAIRRNKVFLITTHINPEADGLGAELAFLSMLRKLGKEGFIVNESKVPPECVFLPGSNTVQAVSKKIRDFDCAVFLDCAEISRVGKVQQVMKAKCQSLNIDHHISNTKFAKVNWVDVKACCTCEMVYELCRKLKVALDSDMALSLYAGIVVDTGNFRYSNASASCHRIAAKLLAVNINPATVYNKLFENNPFEDIKLLGSIVSSIEKDPSGKIVWATISRKILNHIYPEIDLAEVALSLLRSIKGIELAMVFKEVRGKKDQIRINFRSQNNFDCNYLASRFGGGGHRNASGATLEGDFEAVKGSIIKRAKELMRRYA
ncbi:MAG: hypothetical protein A2Y00_00445 [Omnitrophica WOR_2 bacterium GWF2_43_52]|nr:MAG: hypothetical protein A2062_01930 [Omnitrophica WOR_2 bacterium GWA2_44_7]OGX14418.1 MAG: hypothetical protein A2Y01_07620 [Omnitrophica WOR_2 bacterium GWC2_44_8]OGX20933.1 MAG: hypothetical protein A2Y00_00445 [Omnitrophica WOR_2 bacterium GWF2_43_52]OGX55068.1 MAG: hypothetical protein A2460_05790 [Omnitrophica WOR_2 bacterium RIFOXYC2_FULL_43_9]HAH21111.1 hypothetical protein [Candidatus Omnitrophota bacterium]